MTRAKTFAFVLTIIGLTAAFVFGQHNRFSQQLFNLDETNFFSETNFLKFDLLNNSLSYQKSEIPENIIYEQLFRLIEKFQKRAERQDALGNSLRANLLRNHFQQKFQLNNQQTEILKNTSQEFFGEAARLRKRAEEIIKAKRLRLDNSSLVLELSGLEHERRQLSLVYRNRLEERFGLSEFERFASLVQKNIASRMTYRVVSDSAAFFGYSEVFYDEPTQEVSGYSATELDAGLGCGGELLTPCLAAEVNAVLTSDINGTIDYGSDYQCLGTAEVEFFVSGADPSETFCVQGEHEVYEDDYCEGEPDLSKRRLPRSSSFSSEDCVTTPAQPQVTGVSFELIATDDLPIDQNPNAGGGQRIFPNDRVPNDQTNRRRIRVRAGLAENRAGETIYFRNFDLDDPSNDTTIDPNGNAGNDNNGTPQAGQLHTISATTNSNGEATVEFSVTMQPGDNFAIAASTNSDELNAVTVNGMELRTGSGAQIDINCDGTEAVCRSEMLTVWRRLHIEVDSMRASDGNFVLGTIPNERTIRRGQRVTLAVNPSPAQQLEVNRFENGRLVVGDSLSVVSNTTDTVTVDNNNPFTVYVPANAQFQLYDDDDFNDDDGTNLDGDTGEKIFPNRLIVCCNRVTLFVVKLSQQTVMFLLLLIFAQCVTLRQTSAITAFSNRIY